MNKERKVLADIAKNRLGIQTLKQSFSDEKDFHSLAVWKIEEALAEAYAAGQQAIIDSREGE